MNPKFKHSEEGIRRTREKQRQDYAQGMWVCPYHSGPLDSTVEAGTYLPGFQERCFTRENIALSIFGE